MKLYFALSSGEDNKQVFQILPEANILASYFYFKSDSRLSQLKEINVLNTKRFILDSGAYSAYTLGKKINILDYINFIKENKVRQYANLDKIGDPKGTAKNYEIMKKEGLNPKPVFHMGESFKYLEPMLESKYIALGGMVGGINLESWLDEVFNFIYKKTNKIKIHGFGMTNTQLVCKFPWHSVDSTSWLSPVAFGRFSKWDKVRNKFKVIQTDEFLSLNNFSYDNKMPAEIRNFLLQSQVKEYVKFSNFVNNKHNNTNFNYLTAQQKLF